MRLPLLALAALFTVAPALAQRAATPDPSSTYVVPSRPGEVVRVTTYAQRPTVGERLERYRNVRAERSGVRPRRAVRARLAAPTVSTTRRAYVRRGGSYFPVVPQR